MLNVSIVTVLHQEQRYPTVGDYQTDDTGKVIIKVSSMGSSSEELAIGLHELIESHLCKLAGISDQQIDVFDLWYSENYRNGWPEEPGDHPDCPYYKQHQFASIIERMFVRETGIDWHTYDSRVNEMMGRI